MSKVTYCIDQLFFPNVCKIYCTPINGKEEIQKVYRKRIHSNAHSKEIIDIL